MAVTELPSDWVDRICSWTFWVCLFLVTGFFCPWDFWKKKKIWIFEVTRGPFICKHWIYHAFQKQNFIHLWYANIMKSHNFTFHGQGKLRQLILLSLLRRIRDSWSGFQQESKKTYLVSLSGPHNPRKKWPDWRGSKGGPWISSKRWTVGAVKKTEGISPWRKQASVGRTSSNYSSTERVVRQRMKFLFFTRIHMENTRVTSCTRRGSFWCKKEIFLEWEQPFME